MSDKKVTDVMLERIKYFINAIENGEYAPVGYELTIKFHRGGKDLVISDTYSSTSQNWQQ